MSDSRLLVRLAPLLIVACSFDSGGVASSGGSATLGSTGDATSSGSGPSVDPSASITAADSEEDGDDGGTPDTGAVDESSSSSPTPTDDSGSSSGIPVDPTTSTTDVPEVPNCNGEALPELPNEFGPFTEVSVSNVRFAGEGSNVISVAPSSNVDLQFDYEIASCECEGCITQGMMGLVDAPWRDCFYNALPACNTASGTAQMEVETPAEPGLYYVSFWRTWEYACEDDAGGPDIDQAVAAICVLER